MTIADAVKLLKKWAKLDKKARYFEIHYNAAAPHPWTVKLSDDLLSWTVRADDFDSIAAASEYALLLAAKEENQAASGDEPPAMCPRP